LGLSRTEPGRGTLVSAHRPARDLVLRGFSPADLYEARPHIEIPAAQLASARRTSEDLERLTGLIEDMESEDGAEAWVQLDAAFHAAIARASGNSVFDRVVGDIREAMSRQSETVNLVTGRRTPSNAEHRAIVEAIRAADTEAAGNAMAEHLSAVQHAVSTIVRSTK